MTTTMYLRNAKEIAVATRIAKSLGYKITQAEVRQNRYVTNLAARLAGGDRYAFAELEEEIGVIITNLRTLDI
jgi:hypothetical protein